jgi:hypothetical protein
MEQHKHTKLLIIGIGMNEMNELFHKFKEPGTIVNNNELLLKRKQAECKKYWKFSRSFDAETKKKNI